MVLIIRSEHTFVKRKSNIYSENMFVWSGNLCYYKFRSIYF